MCFIPFAINNSLHFTDLAVFGFFSKALKKILDSAFYNHKSNSPNLAPSFFMAISVEIVFICATISISTWQVRFRITKCILSTGLRWKKSSATLEFSLHHPFLHLWHLVLIRGRWIFSWKPMIINTWIISLRWDVETAFRSRGTHSKN